MRKRASQLSGKHIPSGGQGPEVGANLSLGTSKGLERLEGVAEVMRLEEQGQVMAFCSKQRRALNDRAQVVRAPSVHLGTPCRAGNRAEATAAKQAGGSVLD